jgi:hypothetical protein
VKRPDVGDVEEGVKVPPRPAMSSFGVKLRGALEMDRSAVTRHACVEIAVNEVGCKTEALFIESDCIVEFVYEKLRGRCLN